MSKKKHIITIRKKLYGDLPISNIYFFRDVEDNNKFSLNFGEDNLHISSRIVTHHLSDIYFLQPVYIYEDDGMGKSVMRDFLLKNSFNYGGENDLDFLLRFKEWHEDEIQDEVRSMLFYKKADVFNIDNLISCGFKLAWSGGGGLLASLDQKIIIGFFEYGLNIYIENDQKREEIKEKYKQYLVEN